MKTFKTLSALLLVGAALAAHPAMAQTTATTPSTNSAAAAPKRGANQYRGTVASVDATSMTITLKAGRNTPERKVKVTSATVIKKSKEAAQFSDIKAGISINGTGEKDAEGNWTAKTLNITPAKAPAPTPAPAAKE